MSPELLVGGRFELRSRLGRGGFATVWLAADKVLGRDVAVKLIDVDHSFVAAERAEMIRRFRHEAQAVAALNHPNVVTAHDFGVDNDRPYLVMELIRGPSLADELRAHVAEHSKPLPVQRVLAVAAGVCAGLDVAHRAGLVHRDLKPANLMTVTQTGQIKIVDFGIAQLTSMTRLTHSGQVLGTLPYLAPEQLDGREIDGRADLYSLACVIHELLTDRSPFSATSGWQWIAAHLHAAPARLRVHLPSAPAALEALLLEMLAKTPEARPGTAAEVGSRLGEIRAVRNDAFAVGIAPVQSGKDTPTGAGHGPTDPSSPPDGSTPAGPTLARTKVDSPAAVASHPGQPPAIPPPGVEPKTTRPAPADAQPPPAPADAQPPPAPADAQPPPAPADAQPTPVPSVRPGSPDPVPYPGPDRVRLTSTRRGRALVVLAVVFSLAAAYTVIFAWGADAGQPTGIRTTTTPSATPETTTYTPPPTTWTTTWTTTWSSPPEESPSPSMLNDSRNFTGAQWALVTQVSPSPFTTCRASPDEESGGVIAAVNCAPTDPGPDLLPLVLKYSSRSAMDKAFESLKRPRIAASQCAGDKEKVFVGTWHYAGTTKGPLACFYGTNNDNTNQTYYRMTWGYYDTYIVVWASAKDWPTLYQWWRTFRL